MTQTGHLLRLSRFERNVADLLAAVHFYRDALGFSVLSDAEKSGYSWRNLFNGRTAQVAHLKLGVQEIWLTAFEPFGTSYPPESTAADTWFQHCAIVTRDMAESYNRLRTHLYSTISTHGPVKLPSAAGNVIAYKFRDPDSHPLELIHFPAGTGDAQWQNSLGSKSNIGFDHSAINVADAKESLYFYCDLLGMNLVSRQINRGIEQEELDGLMDDVVDVIALTASEQSTPHLELLAYKSPSPRRRSFSPDVFDIVSDRLVFTVDDLTAIMTRLKGSGYAAQAEFGADCVLIIDPDGHFLILEQT